MAAGMGPWSLIRAGVSLPPKECFVGDHQLDLDVDLARFFFAGHAGDEGVGHHLVLGALIAGGTGGAGGSGESGVSGDALGDR